MASWWVLTPLLLLGIVTAQSTSDIEDCDVLNKGVQNTLDKQFSRLPGTHLVTFTDGVKVSRNLLLGNSTIFGLNHLQHDRPYQAFCRGDEAVVQFSVLSTAPLQITVPWRFSSKHNGTISASVRLARYEGHFVVTSSPEGRPLLRLYRFVPSMMNGIGVDLEEVPSDFRSAAQTLSAMFAEAVRLTWLGRVSDNIRMAVSETLSALQ